jgi:hypothetical protein
MLDLLRKRIDVLDQQGPAKPAPDKGAKVELAAPEAEATKE